MKRRTEAALIVSALILSTTLVWPDKVRASVDSLVSTIQFYMTDSGKRMTKAEATKTLLLESDAFVYNCYQVELTEKLTLKKKKPIKLGRK